MLFFPRCMMHFSQRKVTLIVRCFVVTEDADRAHGKFSPEDMQGTRQFPKWRLKPVRGARCNYLSSAFLKPLTLERTPA
jgi:hypothetical protein